LNPAVQEIFFPREKSEKENRVAVLPSTAKKLVAAGIGVTVERSAGEKVGIKDSEYESAGAKMVSDFHIGAKQADIVVRIKCSSCEEIAAMRPGAVHISFFDENRQPEEMQAFQQAKIMAISLEAIPRSTIAQKFDVLSSQANLAGYAAVLIAAANIDKAFPMMMTPAGTIPPVNIFIIGVGVAGLQAIATAKRLGARVEAFDVRSETEEQVKSLGAKFLKIDIGETQKADQGYASELTNDQIEKQRQGMIDACKRADVVITTAKVFGKKSPILVTHEMLSQVDTRTLFIDMAVSTGGNVDGAVADQLVSHGQHIKIFGISEAEQLVASSASQMFAENIYNLIDHFHDKTTGQVVLNKINDALNPPQK
jgi:NAD(P) transhydrogenase subunit alpha